MIDKGLALERLLDFLEEDLGRGDVTSEILIPENASVKAVVLAKSRGTLAGSAEVCTLLEYLGLKVRRLKSDGEQLTAGDTVMEIEGNARAILGAERTILNFIGHLSGVATSAKTLLERAKRVNPEVLVAATRKTIPGLRSFQKKAVMLVGGDSHRYDLKDMVLIKKNHLIISGGMSESVRLAKQNCGFTRKVEAEARNLEEAIEAARAGADIIMLDNMKPEEMKRVVEELERKGLREGLLIEVSGGVTLENIAEYAGAGADVISSGSITHSAQALDVSLEVRKVITT